MERLPVKCDSHKKRLLWILTVPQQTFQRGLFTYRWKVEGGVGLKHEKRLIDRLCILRVDLHIVEKKSSKMIGLVQVGRQKNTIIIKVGHWILGLSDAAKTFSNSQPVMAIVVFFYNLPLLFF